MRCSGVDSIDDNGLILSIKGCHPRFGTHSRRRRGREGQRSYEQRGTDLYYDVHRVGRLKE